MKKRAHPNDQKPEKSQKLGHLKWAKLGPQRHGQQLDATKRNTASPEEEATGLTRLAKLEKPEKQLDPPEEAKAQHI
jgi:hypothetical protein